MALVSVGVMVGGLFRYQLLNCLHQQPAVVAAVAVANTKAASGVEIAATSVAAAAAAGTPAVASARIVVAGLETTGEGSGTKCIYASKFAKVGNICINLTRAVLACSS